MNKNHFLTLCNEKDMHLRLLGLMKIKEQLSVILVTHLACEKVIETWIEAIANNEAFFYNTTIGFAAKLQIAKNCGLPDYFYIFSKNLNKIRNDFAHFVDKDSINNKELEKLEYCTHHLPKETICKDIYSSRFSLGDTEYQYAEADFNKKLGFIFFLIYSSLLGHVNNLD